MLSMSTMNKAARTAMAKETINHLVPSVLSSNPRAQKGVQSSQLFRGSTDLPKIVSNDHGQTQLESTHRGQSSATRPTYSERHPRCSPGATFSATQGEDRSLEHGLASPTRRRRPPRRKGAGRESLYAVNPVSELATGMVPPPTRRRDLHTRRPRLQVPEMKMLEAKDRFYVDVISCAAPRHPGLSGGKDGTSVCYADAADEEMMTLKIKFVMRTAARMGVTHLILGALGCGAYRNPIGQVANIMRKCLVGRGSSRPAEEDWRGAGIEQVVFAILDDSPAKVVWRAFVDELKDYALVVTE